MIGDAKTGNGGEREHLDRAALSMVERWRVKEGNLFKLIDEATDAIVLHRQQTIVYANPRALQLFGYASLPEVVGRSLFDFVSSAYRAIVADRVFQTYFRGQTTSEIEERLLQKNGQEIPAEVIAIPFHLGGEAATLVHIRDITERKKLEVWLRAEDRLASVGLMAAGIAHEVNNPLTYALCNVDLLRARIGAMPPSAATSELNEMLDHVREGVERAVQVAREVTMFSRGERDRTTLLDVHRILDSCANLASVHLRGHARLVKHYGAVPSVLGHGERVGQIFLNLLINAAQAIPPGHEAQNTVTVTTSAQESDAVLVEVRDTGTGIPSEHMAHIFEPLFTTKPEGTGLGLAISRALVVEEGGSLSVESEFGKGSCFRVVLRAAPPDETRPDKTRVPEVRATGKRILVVEDEPHLAKVLGLVLSSHVVTLAASGREALDKLRAGERYDLIVTDLSVGDVDGFALFEAIRAEWPGQESRVIFMSGDAFTQRARAFFRAIPNPVIEKPFESRHLLDVVDTLAASLPPVAPSGA
jgi:two-component system cell cycle sensor histidine kinase/response regulator CckA